MTSIDEGVIDAIQDSPRQDIRIASAVITLFFGLFLGWAALAPLDAGVFAAGQIAITGNRQSVQHREGGIVSTLHVSEGDHVNRGDLLLELSSGPLRASERATAGQVLSLIAQRSRMIAERDRLGEVPTPREFAALGSEDQVVANEALRLQRLQFLARRLSRTTETGVLDQQSEQLRQQIEGLQRQIDSNTEQRRLIAEELDGIRSLAERGFAPQNRVRALERSAAALNGETGSLRAQVAGAREAIGQTRLEVIGVSTKMNENVADQLREVEVNLNELQPRLTELRSQIALNEVRSPSTGQVVGLTVFTVGGVVAPGQKIMDIVPDRAAQVVMASIAPTDIDNVRIGLKAEVKFPGLRDRFGPLLYGSVSRISADAFTDERTGNSHYRVEVVIPAAELGRLGASRRRIRPGMPVEVVFMLRKRTVLQYLLEPLVHSLWRTGAQE